MPQLSQLDSPQFSSQLGSQLASQLGWPQFDTQLGSLSLARSSACSLARSPARSLVRSSARPSARSSAPHSSVPRSWAASSSSAPRLGTSQFIALQPRTSQPGGQQLSAPQLTPLPRPASLGTALSCPLPASQPASQPASLEGALGSSRQPASLGSVFSGPVAGLPRSPALPPSLRRPLRVPCLDVLRCSSTTRKGESYHRAGGDVQIRGPGPRSRGRRHRRAERSALRAASHPGK